MAGLCEVCADSVTKSVCRSVCRSVRVSAIDRQLPGAF